MASESFPSQRLIYSHLQAQDWSAHTVYINGVAMVSLGLALCFSCFSRTFLFPNCLSVKAACSFLLGLVISCSLFFPQGSFGVSFYCGKGLLCLAGPHLLSLCLLRLGTLKRREMTLSVVFKGSVVLFLLKLGLFGLAL